jgi:N-methylhydantoinase B
MHLPLICDRYEVRDDAARAGNSARRRGVVVVALSVPGFMTTNRPQRRRSVGILGGQPGHCSKVELKKINRRHPLSAG